MLYVMDEDEEFLGAVAGGFADTVAMVADGTDPTSATSVILFNLR